MEYNRILAALAITIAETVVERDQARAEVARLRAQLDQYEQAKAESDAADTKDTES